MVAASLVSGCGVDECGCCRDARAAIEGAGHRTEVEFGARVGPEGSRAWCAVRLRSEERRVGKEWRLRCSTCRFDERDVDDDGAGAVGAVCLTQISKVDNKPN